MNKNYFNDITDLFLKVKKEENIKIDENAKANIKEMLQTQINLMKGAPEATAEETYDNLEPLGPKRSFWSMWKNQLVGVPASLAAIALVVYAASNLNVSFEKEDFSPTRDTQTNITQTESVIEEESTEAEAEPKEFDRPLVKTAEGKLVIDFSETEGERTLNQVPTKTGGGEVEPQPTVETPEVVLDDPVEPQEETADPETDEAVVTETAEDTTKEVEESTASSQPAEEVEEPEEVEAIEIIPDQPDPVDSLDADIPLDENVERIADPVEIETEKHVVITPDISEESALIPAKFDFPVYTYQDESLKDIAAFSEEKLAKLTRSKTPESVTVYYVDENQVVVEIEENDTVKWYLFDRLNETWTISKYEKFHTDRVVK